MPILTTIPQYKTLNLQINSQLIFEKFSNQDKHTGYI